MKQASSALFTVAIAVDDTDIGLEQTILSVLRQDWPAIELVLINNAVLGLSLPRIAELIRDNRKPNLVSVYMHSNAHALLYDQLFEQLYQAGTGKFFTVLIGDEQFAEETTLSAAAIFLQQQEEKAKSIATPVFCEDQQATFTGSLLWATFAFATHAAQVVDVERTALTFRLSLRPAAVSRDAVSNDARWVEMCADG